jgi:hypothetical protein
MPSVSREEPTMATPRKPNAKSAVTALAKQYGAAYLARDARALDKILDDEWTLITAGCADEVYKPGQLRDLRSGALKVDKIRDSQVRVRVYGDAAVVTGRRVSTVTYKGRDVSDVTRFSQFYALGEKGWRCVSTQVTSIRPDPDRA